MQIDPVCRLWNACLYVWWSAAGLFHCVVIGADITWLTELWLVVLLVSLLIIFLMLVIFFFPEISLL